jgi:hypothetical protein
VGTVVARGEALAQAQVPHAPSAPNALSAAPAQDDGDALSKQIDLAYTQVQIQARAQGGDCTMACRALESMRRATERLCAIEPGNRCAEAIRKVGDATQRVRAACPTCPESLVESSPAPVPADAPSRAEPEPATQGTGASTRSFEVVASAEGAKKRGGCAGCSTPGSADRDAFTMALPLAAILVLSRVVSGSRRRKA